MITQHGPNLKNHYSVKALFKLAYYDLQNGHTDLALAKP